MYTQHTGGYRLQSILYRSTQYGTPTHPLDWHQVVPTQSRMQFNTEWRLRQLGWLNYSELLLLPQRPLYRDQATVFHHSALHTQWGTCARLRTASPVAASSTSWHKFPFSPYARFSFLRCPHAPLSSKIWWQCVLFALLLIVPWLPAMRHHWLWSILEVLSINVKVGNKDNSGTLQAICGLTGRNIYGCNDTHWGCAISVNSTATGLLKIARGPPIYTPNLNYIKH
jgi:hypothetical protein